MDGHRVMPIAEAAREGDLFVTVTGNLKVVTGDHLAAMKDGAIVANAGHFNAEIDIPALERDARSKRRVRPFVDEYTYPDGHRVYLLGEGRLINLAAAEGHPAAVMDMSFANQALASEYMLRHHQRSRGSSWPRSGCRSTRSRPSRRGTWRPGKRARSAAKR
jgi:adenosylhomocysteinase